jgi:uncharacterized protein (TIGR02271 family)
LPVLRVSQEGHLLRTENQRSAASRSRTEKEDFDMANKPAVHVELRENGWAVVREGSERANTVHPTQSEAAKAGRELARHDGTEFFLHAQDGRVREHRSYGEGSPTAPSPTTPPEDKGLVDQATGTAGALAGGVVGAAARAVGAAGAAVPTAGNRTGQEAERSGDTPAGGSVRETPDEGTSDTEEAHDLTDAHQDESLEIPEERYAGYEVYDADGERIGKPDDLFVDEDDSLEYVGVWTDSSGTRSLLVPAEVVTVEDASRRMVVSRPKGVVEAAPSLGRGEELTPGLEERVRRHYGNQGLRGAEGSRGGYGAYYRGDAERAEERGRSGAAISGAPTPSGAGDVGGRTQDREDMAEPGILEGDEVELRVRRSEEELRVGTREREAGAVRVRKRVRTDRERIVVPKKRVEVTVERVPVVEGEAAGSEIAEGEIVVPIVEEEVVVEKRPVVKEELRIRKEVVEEAEVVVEDVRREEIDVDDQTKRRDA